MMFSNENTMRIVTAEEISTWKVQKLKNFCKEHKIKGYSKLRKAELVALVTDFVKNHGEAKIETKSRLSITPAPLTEKFATSFSNTKMREYVKRKKLAEEKEYLRCWRSVLLTLTKNAKTGDLEAEFDAVLRNIELCERRIANYENRPAKIDFSEAAASAASYTENLRLAFIARKHRKAA